MSKSKLLQILIVIIITVIVAYALFSSAVSNVTISEHIETSTGNRLITWTLNSGQKVEGSLNYSMIDFNSTFKIVQINAGLRSQIYEGSITNSKGDFSFNTNTGGLYVLYGPIVLQNNKLDYTYTISTLIMGLDLATFTGLMIVIGAVIELIILASKMFSQKNSAQ